MLDVAAGYGEPSLTAARAAGPEGSVVATDISAEMIAFGRERAAAAGLDNIEFVESDAAGLDFPEGSFDAALSRWGIIFEPDGEAAAARVRGFLKAGARMAISSWGPPDRVPFLGDSDAHRDATAATCRRRRPERPVRSRARRRRRWVGCSKRAASPTSRWRRPTSRFEWESPEEFTTFIKEIAPPITAMIDPQPQEVQDETWAAITEAMREAAGDDGTVRLSNLVLLAAGRN